MRMYCNLNGKMSLILGIFPASIGKKYFFFALGTIPETGVCFIGRKNTEIRGYTYKMACVQVTDSTTVLKLASNDCYDNV